MELFGLCWNQLLLLGIGAVLYLWCVIYSVREIVKVGLPNLDDFAVILFISFHGGGILIGVVIGILRGIRWLWNLSC